MADCLANFAARRIRVRSLLFGFTLPALLLFGAQQQTSTTPFTLQTSTNRVIVDVGVKDARGTPVRGLHRETFSVKEDGQTQTILSFDAHDLDQGMDYVPPTFPAMRPNTYVNLPRTPQRGPLYVLLYDLVNIPVEDQIPARAALVRFLGNKPAGTRFAIFVVSDGLHMIQGFTANRQTLVAAVDPKRPEAHIPKVFLMGRNFGQDDPNSARAVLASIARYLAPLQGRKNLLWFSAKFPLSLFAADNVPAQYQQRAKQTLNLLANSQIAVYPVDVRGLMIANEYAPPGSLGVPGAASVASPAPAGPSQGRGVSLVSRSYAMQDDIAKTTGGEAIYSTNGLEGALQRATEDGGNYYSLMYSPSDRNFDGRLRHIEVLVKGGEYRLSYRRAYYGTSAPEAGGAGAGIAAFMRHGEPEMYQLVFGLEVKGLDGTPEGGTRGRDKAQTYTLIYGIRPEEAAGTAVKYEVAAAVFDAEGTMLNSVSSIAEPVGSARPSANGRSFRIEQELSVPAAAKFLRVAVRDQRTEHVGALELALPLDHVAKGGDVKSR